MQNVHPFFQSFFREITQHQFSGVCKKLKVEGSPAAKTRKKGSGAVTRIDSPTKRRVVALAATPENSSHCHDDHNNQRQISRELGISKGYVFKI